MKNSITTSEYTAAVTALVELASQCSSSARIAAQVLLSSKNGDRFQLNITDLCNLDEDHYDSALAVIRGRVELRREPQEMIPNGSKVFLGLMDKWSRLELVNRSKNTI